MSSGYERLFGDALSDFRSSPISRQVSPLGAFTRVELQTETRPGLGARALPLPQIARLEVRLENLGVEEIAGRLSRLETPPLQRPGCLHFSGFRLLHRKLRTFKRECLESCCFIPVYLQVRTWRVLSLDGEF